MQLTGKKREFVDIIKEYIESKGGSFFKECKGGSMYFALDPLKKIRISDHLSIKVDINKLDIVINEIDNTFYFLCVYYRNLKIFKDIKEVLQWIDDMHFMLSTIILNKSVEYIIEKHSYTEQITKLKEEITKNERQIVKHKKEIASTEERMNRELAVKDDMIEKLKERLSKHVKYHNELQEALSRESKLLKKLEKYEKEVETVEAE